MKRPGTTKTPAELKLESKDKEAVKRAGQKEILKIADELKNKNLDTLLDIVRKSLHDKRKMYEVFKDTSVEDILKVGTERWICRKAVMMQEIRTLENVANLPAAYDKQADRILNPKSTSAPGRKKQEYDGGNNGKIV